MLLPCLQRESKEFHRINFNLSIGNNYAAMNERLIRGENNTNMPFPSQGFEMELNQVN